MTTLLAPPGGYRSAFVLNLAWTAGDNMVRFAVSLALARLLLPEDMGRAAIGLAVIGVLHVLRDCGVGAYLQCEPELSADRFSNCLGVLCAATAVLSVWLLVAAGPLARHFGQPGLVPLLSVLLLGFVLSPFGVVMAALLQRDLAARQMAAVSRVGTLSHALTGLGLAALGFGAMSLAWAYVVNILVCGGAYWRLRPAGRVWRLSLRGWRPVLRFGGGALLNSGLAGLNNAVPDLLLARLGAVQQVGLMGRANAVVNLFSAVAGTAINFGALRILADLHARDAAVAPPLRRATALLTGVGWPVLALIALFHQELIALLYGPAWRESGTAVAPLATVAALGLLFNYVNVALAAIGRPHLAAAHLGVSLLARCALAGWFFDGRLVSFAWVLLGAAVAALPVQLFLAARHLGQSLVGLLALVTRSLVPTVAAVGCAALLQDQVVVALPTAAAVWLLALHGVRHELVGELRQLLPRLRSTIRK
jgi:O-antigen/teichoic acid export membrane protein